jgi:hypothetical protein
MYVALPRSDYYENSALSRCHQPTTNLAATVLAAQWEGDTETVPTFTV